MTILERLPPGRYRLNVADYAMLGGTGAFGDAGTELIDGEIVVMSPEWVPHMRIKDELAYRLRRALEEIGGLVVGTGGSVELTQHDTPRPDIIVARALNGQRGLAGELVAMLVEVSSTTLRDDLGLKQRLYAQHRIPEYWVVDVNGRVIHQMWAPAGQTYAQRREIAFGAAITAETIAGLTIETGAL